MSFDLRTHLRSKQGDVVSLFSTQPMRFNAFLMSGYPPVHINTLVFSSTLYFFFQVAISVILGKITFLGLFLSKNDSIGLSNLFFFLGLVSS